MALRSGRAHLNISNSLIGAAGAQAVAEGLKVNLALASLILNECQIGDEGAKAIAAALEVNHTVTHLNLMNNGIGDIGAVVALIDGPTLERLFLEGNVIDEEAADDVVTILYNNPRLMTFEWDHYSPAVYEILARNKSRKKDRASQLMSFLSAAEDPSTLPYNGLDVFRNTARSIKRALLCHEYDCVYFGYPDSDHESDGETE